jgi:PIN domain nuclease of toxin-antitoxin system
VSVFVAFLLSAALAAADDSTAIAKLVDDINAAVRTDKRRMLSIITINTDVATTTLEQEKARTGLSFGDIYVAHALSLATRKKFDTIIALKTSGQSWAQIARGHKVTLKGSRELIKEMQKQ